jgi:hypothetical protein
MICGRDNPRCAAGASDGGADEKSQIQALDRSQPMLPMRPGQPARRADKRSDRDDETWFLRDGDGRLIARARPSGARLA